MTPTFPAEHERLAEIRHFVTEQIGLSGLDPSLVQKVVLAVSEVCSNVLMHTDSDHIELALHVTNDRVDVEVRDSGVFHPGLETTGGRGIFLMTALVDEVSIHAGSEESPGTVVRLTKYVD